jgi:hypothetical protein
VSGEVLEDDVPGDKKQLLTAVQKSTVLHDSIKERTLAAQFLSESSLWVFHPKQSASVLCIHGVC